MNCLYLVGIVLLVLVLMIGGIIIHDYNRASLWFKNIDKKTKLCRKCGAKHYKKELYGSVYWDKSERNDCDCTYLL